MESWTGGVFMPQIAISHLRKRLMVTGSCLLHCLISSAANPAIPGAGESKTIFQSADPPAAEYDIRSDAAVVYGVDDAFPAKVKAWKDLGYRVQMMTGSAWGEYSHYIDGRFDGKRHEDEGQVDPQGNVIWHHPGVPYMVPSDSFIEFLKTLTRRAIDEGVEAVHLEEPEFWSRAGYSESFKKLWQQEYDEPWQRPDSSPDAFWRGSKLKYLLYKRALEQVFADGASYAAGKGREVKFYVPTHSLVSYSQWAIVSPESSLMDLANCDGYIAQVWTGTARTPNHYRGVHAERTFETAFLEYSSMYYMVAPTGRTVYFLHDPVEDSPNRTWDDYRANYQRTVAASLLFPDVHHYEVMPWPRRVFTFDYPSGSYASDDGKTTIPQSYAAELMTVVNALNDMEQKETQWECGNTDIGVMVSDTMMFQRGNSWGKNGPIEFNGFYGMALPLVKAGIPVRCLVLERCMQPGALEQVKVLLMSYEVMKPLKPEYHDRIAEWVKKGGRLVYIGDDSDPFHTAREWWNGDGATSATAREHLFAKLGAGDGKAAAEGGSWAAGNGWVTWHKEHPAKLAMDGAGPEKVLQLASGADTGNERPLVISPHIRLRRGPYLTGAVLHESSIEQPMKLSGLWVDLFSSGTEIVRNPIFNPQQVFLLRSLNEPPGDEVRIIASSARVEETTATPQNVEWLLRGPSSVANHRLLVRMKKKPRVVTVDGTTNVETQWNEDARVLRVEMPWKAEGMRVRVEK